MSYEKPRSDSVKVKIGGSLARIEAVRKILEKNFKILSSAPIYENERKDGYHTFLTLGDPQP